MGWNVAVTLIALVIPSVHNVLPEGDKDLARLEVEEVAFARSSLLREAGSASALQNEEKREGTIRRAYRSIAKRYRQNLFWDAGKFEFQLRVLNLARDALLRGESFEDVDSNSGESKNSSADAGHELPPGSRISDEIMGQMNQWQEYCLEEGIRFDDPSTPYYVGHTQYSFQEAFHSNWTEFVLNELAELWPPTLALRLQVLLGSNKHIVKHKLAERVTAFARDQVAAVAEALHACGARNPPLAGMVPDPDDSYAWADLQLRTAQALRTLLSAPCISRGETCDLCKLPSYERTALLEMSLKALEQLAVEVRSGPPPLAPLMELIVVEVQRTYAAVISAQTERPPPHCQTIAMQKHATLIKYWEEYNFGDLIAEAYPLDACGLHGLAMFLSFHLGSDFSQLPQRAEPDRTVLRGVRGIFTMQQALQNPAAVALGWRDAIADLEAAVWTGIAFPELHVAAAKVVAEVAHQGLLPEVLEVALEHPSIVGLDGVQLPHGREPIEIQAPKERRFGGFEVPGYSLRPIQRFEERALELWGDENDEDHWDPVRLAYAFLDLTASCEMPVQVAVCFVNAAAWFWRAMDLLGDDCGGIGWLDNHIFEDLWSVSPADKRRAMIFALKTGAVEFIEYAANFVEYQVSPGARLAVLRYGYNILNAITSRYGTTEDASRVSMQLRRLIRTARMNPFWSPPATLVSDAFFLDLLGGRMHAAYLQHLRELIARSGQLDASDKERDFRSPPPALPHTVLDYAPFEAALFGFGEDFNTTFARFEAMGALLKGSGRQWEDIEACLEPWPMPVDAVGFTVGSSPSWPVFMNGMAEYSAVVGVKVNLETGYVALLLARPVKSTPVFSVQDVVDLLGLEDMNPLFLSLDTPSDTLSSQFLHHPFQQVVTSPKTASRRTEVAMLQAALALQQVASGTELSKYAPFPLRPCAEGLCRGLPQDAQKHLTPLTSLPGEPWDSPRLFFECGRVNYEQRMQGHSLEVLFHQSEMEVHAGKPLSVLDEEVFRHWTVAKLRKALQQVEADPRNELPVLEKMELVDRLLRALEKGALLDDEDEGPTMRFARRFRHHLPKIIAHWPHVALLAQICALRAASFVVRSRLEDMKLNAAQHSKAVEESVEGEVRMAHEDRLISWREILSGVHATVLQELGFVDLNPGLCWNGDARDLRGSNPNFAKCCSLGDYQTECWPDGLVAHDFRRCCGAAARHEGFAFSFMASVATQLSLLSPRRPSPQVMVPAVVAWLGEPTGRAEDGSTFSSAVVALLCEDVSREDFLRDARAQISRPGERLEADLQALTSNGTSNLRPETWIPTIPLDATGRRQVLYVTVAVTPMLQEGPVERPEWEHLPGVVEEVSLVDLSRRAAELQSSLDGENESKCVADGNCLPNGEEDVLSSPIQQAADEALEMIHGLHDETVRMEAESTVPGNVKRSKIMLDPTIKCSSDGWQELTTYEASKIQRGAEVRVRRRHGSYVVEDNVGKVIEIISVTSGPGDLVVLWEVRLQDDLILYHNFHDPALTVLVPCDAQSNINVSDSAQTVEWPGCIEKGIEFPSFDGAGLFVNLLALGVTSGCFQRDCSHSDHFTAKSPVECAQTCDRVAACHGWTFWEAPPTCWLRKEGYHRTEAPGSVSGTSFCTPSTGPKIHEDATLMSIISGSSGTLPRPLWEEWSLASVLMEYGTRTVAEIRAEPYSMARNTALRVANIVNPSISSV